MDYSDNRTDYDDILLIDAKTYCSIRRISVEGKLQTRFPIDERKRPPGILERATPPFGCKLIEAPRSAAQKCGAKIKKKLEVYAVKAETVRLIFKPYLLGDGSLGALGNVDQEPRCREPGTSTCELRAGGQNFGRRIHETSCSVVISARRE